jgi:hypothetical protein
MIGELPRAQRRSYSRLAVDTGLAVFEAGAEFADGVIAFEGGLHQLRIAELWS